MQHQPIQIARPGVAVLHTRVPDLLVESTILLAIGILPVLGLVLLLIT